MKKNIVVLSYGRTNEYQRAIFAVLSFWAWYSGPTGSVQTIIYTDNPDYFRPYLAELPVHYELLTPERLARMRGPENYVHRVKPVMLAEVFGAYPEQDVLYTDTDAFFVLDPAPLLARLTAGVSVMHQPEYLLQEAEAVFAGFGQQHYPQQFLAQLETELFRVGGQPARFYSRQVMWNSGILGISHRQAALLPDVLALTDSFFARTKWFLSEQVSFSLVLQTQTHLTAGQPFLLHYWGVRQKKMVDKLLAELLQLPFAQRPMPERLEHLRQLTSQWLRHLEGNRLREGSLYAFANHQPLAGLKYALKSLFRAPLSRYYFRRILAIRRRQQGLRAA